MATAQIQAFRPSTSAYTVAIYVRGGPGVSPLLFFSASPAMSDFAAKDKVHTSMLASGINSLLCELEPSATERGRCLICPLFLGDMRSVYAGRKDEGRGRRRACCALFNETVGRGCTPLSSGLTALISRVSKQLRGRGKKGSDTPPPLSEVRCDCTRPRSLPGRIRVQASVSPSHCGYPCYRRVPTTRRRSSSVFWRRRCRGGSRAPSMCTLRSGGNARVTRHRQWGRI